MAFEQEAALRAYEEKIANMTTEAKAAKAELAQASKGIGPRKASAARNTSISALDLPRRSSWTTPRRRSWAIG